MIKANNANPYLRTKILTATPEELRMMLYDGAIKFCGQARLAIEKNDFETSYDCLMRAQKIVLELSTSLDHTAAPELCSRLSSLYTYIYRRLVDANVNHEIAAITESIELLQYEKETWRMLMDKLNKEGNPRAGVDQVQIAGAQQTAISSLSHKI